VSDKDFAQPSFQMRPENPKPQTGRCRQPHGRGRAGFDNLGGGNVHQASLKTGIGNCLQFLDGRTLRADGRQALLDVATVLFQVSLHQRVEQGVGGLLEGTLFDEDSAQRPCLVQHPGMHACDQGIAADEIHLQSQDAEEQITVSIEARRN
jgi:hypothetical protein